MTKPILLSSLLFLFLFSEVRAQDPEFTQFYAAPLYLNPAFAGSKDIRVHMNFRDQWPSLPQAYVTLAVAYDQYFKKLDGGIGIIAVSDRAGDGIYQSNRISGIYSYKLELGRKFAMHLALEGTYVEKSIDWDRLFWSDQIHPIFGFYDPGNNPYGTAEPVPADNRFSYLDFSGGILGYGRKVFFGASVSHITEPPESILGDAGSILPMRYVAHVGWVMNYGSSENKSTFISPNLLVTSQDNFNQIVGGAYINKSALFGGFWYRHTLGNTDAMIALVGTKLGDTKIGYSFDFSLSELIAHSGGSHELSVVMEFKSPERKGNKRQLYCPSGF